MVLDIMIKESIKKEEGDKDVGQDNG